MSRIEELTLTHSCFILLILFILSIVQTKTDRIYRMSRIDELMLTHICFILSITSALRPIRTLPSFSKALHRPFPIAPA